MTEAGHPSMCRWVIPIPAMVETTAELLLNRGADAHAKDAAGETPCQLAREREGFFFDTQFVNRMCSP